ncbi:DUF2441 domain-containing protein [Neisseria sp. Ec49-e6-T10]|uniref:DUF2441 domain-containing protein n=1 Tax=Neisseria sp. Ec49-e6-T10 TaxID=3140744 RepID=UPI003EBE8383
MSIDQEFYSVRNKDITMVGQNIGMTQPSVPECIKSNSELVSFFEGVYKKGFSKHGEYYLLNFFWREAKSLNEQGKIEKGVFIPDSHLIEIIFEQRRQVKNGKPSRFESLFAWDNIDDAKEFLEKRDKESPNKYAIFRVKALSKNIHKGDMNLLHRTNSFAVAMLYADDYWDGKPNISIPPKWEYLLPLPVKVVERMEI